MSLDNRLSKLEKHFGLTGTCTCPRNAAVWYQSYDGTPDPPTERPRCEVCGLERELITVLYVKDWRSETPSVAM